MKVSENVLEEDQPQDDVLVLGEVHAAELVRRVPERGSRLLVARAGLFGLGPSSSEAAGGLGKSGVLAPLSSWGPELPADLSDCSRDLRRREWTREPDADALSS